MSNITDELIKFDKEHILKSLCPVGQNVGVVFEGGHGVIIRDTTGKEYIDISSQGVNCNLGHCHKELINAAIEQLNKSTFTTQFTGYSHTAVVECSRKLAEIVPDGLDHFTFANSGSEAVDAVLMIARSYWHNKGKSKYKIISLQNSYHGVVYGCITASGLVGLWRGMLPLAPGFVHMPRADCYRCPFSLEYPNCNIRCARYLAQVIEQEGKEYVAAFIAEPIQGAGGFIVPPAEYWPIIRKICTEYDILFIADEVQSGFGRAGKFFAIEHWDVTPDMMTMAKGITGAHLPFSAVAINKDIWENLKPAPFFQSTVSAAASPVCCAVAARAIQVYQRDKILDNVAKVGKHVMERLKAEFEPLPCVGAVYGKGLMCGIRLVTDKASKSPLLVGEEFRQQARENGLFLMTAAGGEVIRFSPPLIITTEEADRALDILKPIVAALKPS